MITTAYVRTMAAYNVEMNRRLYAAAGRLSDAERRTPRGAFWGSLHGTLAHILWGDRQWMSRFAGWPKPATPIAESARLIDDFGELAAAREEADTGIARWAEDSTRLGSAATWCGSAVRRTARSAPRSGCW